MAPSSGGYFLWMKIVNGMSKVGKMEGYLKERVKLQKFEAVEMEFLGDMRIYKESELSGYLKEKSDRGEISKKRIRRVLAEYPKPISPCRQLYLLSQNRCKMVRSRRTRKVLRGRGPWPRLDTILNYKRDPSHSTNEHVDHVANIFKRFEEEYILESNRKNHILQMSLTEPDKKVLENIWESIQEGPHGFTNRSFDDLVAIFKEHWEKCFVKNAIR
uniref:Uncharacterized protein n=1 Tax=Vitis vinifera TaxID=29760 RepID=A5AGN4_VITVI|nr:hypothetical protein VITISV_003455 [Vitis vinifera]